MTDIVLVPVDGSDHADRAVLAAAQLAKTQDAKILALHVMSENVSDKPPPGLSDYQRAEHVRLSERSMLESRAEQILRYAQISAREKADVEVETILIRGDAASTILDVARDRKVNLIVMGSRGLGTLKGLLLGGVSQKVSQLCECNCLLVK